MGNLFPGNTILFFLEISYNLMNKIKGTTMALYFVDVESTGVDLKNDRLIQLAFLKVQGDNIEAFNDLCYTDIEMNDTVVNIHHITNAMLEDKYWPYETDAFIELEKGNNPSNYFIAHGNELDVAMLEHEELILEMQKIDTDKCARLLLKEAASYKLEDLIIRYNLTQKVETVAKQIGLKSMTLCVCCFCMVLIPGSVTGMDGRHTAGPFSFRIRKRKKSSPRLQGTM